MRTDAITEGLEVSSPVDTEEIQQATTKDKQIANLSEHPGWITIHEMMKEKVNYYKKMNGVDTSNLTLEEVGQKYIVSNLVASELEQILNIVTQTANEINNVKTT